MLHEIKINARSQNVVSCNPNIAPENSSRNQNKKHAPSREFSRSPWAGGLAGRLTAGRCSTDAHPPTVKSAGCVGALTKHAPPPAAPRSTRRSHRHERPRLTPSSRRLTRAGGPPPGVCAVPRLARRHARTSASPPSAEAVAPPARPRARPATRRCRPRGGARPTLRGKARRPRARRLAVRRASPRAAP